MRMAKVRQISENWIAIGEKVLATSLNVTGLNEISVAEVEMLRNDFSYLS